jgi:hypothetical protein
MKANASKEQSMKYSQMKKKERDLKAEIDRWFEQADEIDQEEDERYGSQHRGDELPEWVTDKQKRLEKIQKAKAELEAEARAAAQAPKDPTRTKHESKPTGVPKEKAQKNFTDRDSQIMKVTGGYQQSYN